MADLITLACPTCGGSLQVTNDADRFVCMHCGNTHIVDPETRAASLAGEVQTLRAEVTTQRLQSELAILKKRRDEARVNFEKAEEHNRYVRTARILSASSIPVLFIVGFVMYKYGGYNALSMYLLPFLGLMFSFISFAVPLNGTGKTNQAAKNRLTLLDSEIARREEELKQVQPSHLMSDTHHAIRNTQ
ncbi:MAG TPA: hypothetical protein VII92_06095 [Anaerolineae bacterium]